MGHANEQDPPCGNPGRRLGAVEADSAVDTGCQKGLPPLKGNLNLLYSCVSRSRPPARDSDALAV